MRNVLIPASQSVTTAVNDNPLVSFQQFRMTDYGSFDFLPRCQNEAIVHNKKKKRTGTSLHTTKKNASASTAISDLKKSVNMLKAYGEYEKFLQISKKFMKDRGISIGKNQAASSWGYSLGQKKGKKFKRRGSHNLGTEVGKSTEIRKSRMRESGDE